MSKHTPGPWAIYMPEEGHECPGIEAAGVSIIVFAPELLPCEDGGVQGHTVEEAAANARLIAAAPQLLEALQAVLLWGTNTNYEKADAAVNQALAAIATATQEASHAAR